jgi:putative transposase
MNPVQQHLLASGKSLPVSRLCQWLGLPRSTAYYQPRERKSRPVDEVLAARIKRIHQEEPACGVRGTWSHLRFVESIRVNRKKVHRIMRWGQS